MREKGKICNPSPSEMESKKKMKDMEKSVDPELWHACAGGMVQIPQVNNKIFYFPQGHAEHARELVNFMDYPQIPHLIPCRVVATKYMADHETDEVYVKLKLVPLHSEVSLEDDNAECSTKASETKDKPQCFAKILTQSDANNGGGFSCPRYCAEKLFPCLDYSTSPPVQDIFPKDIHDQKWQFKHIYRGTPKRHLLTTGWSQFVTHKKLVAGDSIVFLKAENGDIRFGIRRARREICAVLEPPSGYEPATATAIQEEDNNNSKVQRNSRGNALRISDGMMGKGKVSAQQVIQAATLAANMQPFEVVYYPRSNTPEFFVKTSAVRASLHIRWFPGMRIQMAIETEDSSRISWFNGTVTFFEPIDPKWPHSPWRALQVTWDDTELLQNVKRLNPWQVKIEANVPPIHLPTFTPPPPRKKLRLLPHLTFPIDHQFSMSNFSNIFQSPISPFCQFPEISPAGMQGARHAHFLPNLQPFNHTTTTSTNVSCNTRLQKSNNDDNMLCMLSISSSTESSQKSDHVKQQQLVLFGKKIIIEQQVPPSTIFEAKNENAEKSMNQAGNENAEKLTDDFSNLHLPCLSERPFLERLELNESKETKDGEHKMNLSEPSPKWLGG
ncbi:auxin response factor 18 [Cicer arietinum]|uniref:Auxin response factor n=1 Tax=Cicer arietinum TaxID=3827 RepID=A0A1S2YVN7_CICAR|nr:auxin response factor 18 [Cicer arietinum]